MVTICVELFKLIDDSSCEFFYSEIKDNVLFLILEKMTYYHHSYNMI